MPGASITTGGDLNTLDILNSINLDSGSGITIGRDLNLLNVGQDIDLSNGASISVGRFLGTIPQPPKGTATGSNILAENQALVGTGSTTTTVPAVSGYIQGSINISGSSTITVAAGIANSSAASDGTVSNPTIFLVNGSVNTTDLADQLNIPLLNPGIVVGGDGVVITNEPANFVARNGFFLNGMRVL